MPLVQRETTPGPRKVKATRRNLAACGHIDEARCVLHNIERLWPGTASRSKLNFATTCALAIRARAIRLQDALEAGGAYDRFLQARIDPSNANVDRLVTYIRGPPGFRRVWAVFQFGTWRH